MKAAGPSVSFDMSAWGVSPWTIGAVICMIILFVLVMRAIRKRH